MPPYRASAEPEPEVLWSARAARFTHRRSALLAGTIGATFGASMLALVLGAPVIGGALFTIFLGTAAASAQKKWLLSPKLEVRVERVGVVRRLRVTTTSIALNEPLSVTGTSRMDEGDRLVMQLEVRGANGSSVTLGAIALPLDAAPTRDEWFDGAPLAPAAPPGDLMVETPARLVSLRDFLASPEAT